MLDVYKGAIVTQVFQAIDGEGRLPVGEKISLEYLSQDDDGIFQNEKSWRRFLYGNFGDGAGSYYLEGEPSANLLKNTATPSRNTATCSYNTSVLGDT